MRKPFGRFAIILALSAMLALCTAGVTAFAEDNNLAAGTAEFDAAKAQSEPAPPTFDLRNVDGKNYVSPVRLQNPFGVCWGFAAIAACETDLITEGYENDPAQVDLSEKHLVYFSHMYLDDPSNPQNGEGMHVFDDAAADGIQAQDIYAGSTVFLATNTFAAGMGPVKESSDPSFLYKGNPGTIVQQVIDGVLVDICYSADDDWNLDESLRFEQDYVLRESYLLPNPATFELDLTAYTNTYVYNEAGTAAIKEQLMNKHAVTIGFHADTSRPWQQEGEQRQGEYMDANTWAHYTWEHNTKSGANHAVTIVGWDDNYSRDNFPTEHRPPANGAWLVKNSWGAGTNDFPNRGDGKWGIPVEQKDADGNTVLDENGDPVMVGSGYFWLSFYDQSIDGPEVLLFGETLSSRDGYYNFTPDELIRDQHDLMPAAALSAQEFGDEMKMANVFTASESEHVVGVSYEVGQPNTTVSYEVRLLAPDYSSPEDGLIVAAGDETYRYGGFYMDFFIPMVTVQKGQSYSIVVTQRTEKGGYMLNVPTGQGKNSMIPIPDPDLAPNEYSVAVINEGESLLYKDGVWSDWSDEAVRIEALTGNEPQAIAILELTDAQLDNFPIKGFAISRTVDADVRLADGAQSVTLYVGDTVPVNLELVGSDASNVPGLDERVTWKFYDDNGSLVSLAEGDNPLQALITGLKPGKTRLVATVADLGTIFVDVEVLEREAVDPKPNDEPDPSADTDSQTTPVNGSSTKATASPKTGDPLGIWTGIALVAVVSAVIAFVASRRSKA